MIVFSVRALVRFWPIEVLLCAIRAAEGPFGVHTLLCAHLTCRHPRAWALLLWLSLLCLSIPVVNANPQLHPEKQQAAGCKLDILGMDSFLSLNSTGNLQQASMSCAGTATATISLNPEYLGSFQTNFTGVNLTSSCESGLTNETLCLITLCSGPWCSGIAGFQTCKAVTCMPCCVWCTAAGLRCTAVTFPTTMFGP